MTGRYVIEPASRRSRMASVESALIRSRATAYGVGPLGRDRAQGRGGSQEEADGYGSAQLPRADGQAVASILRLLGHFAHEDCGEPVRERYLRLGCG